MYAPKTKFENELQVESGESCVRNSADMLLDSLLLGYADALVLPMASTFSVLPKVRFSTYGFF